MASSKSKPEEELRQKLLQKMTGEWGYPKSLIAVEKGIGTRRFDILVYERKSLKPLLLIECKAKKLTESAYNQVFGYNDAIGAPFLSLASATEIKTFWREGTKIVSVPFLPTYDALYDTVRIRI